MYNHNRTYSISSIADSLPHDVTIVLYYIYIPHIYNDILVWGISFYIVKYET